MERERSADEGSEHMRIKGIVAVRNSGDGNSTWRGGKRNKLKDRRVQPGWQGNERSEVPVLRSSRRGGRESSSRDPKDKREQREERKGEREGKGTPKRLVHSSAAMVIKAMGEVGDLK